MKRLIIYALLLISIVAAAPSCSPRKAKRPKFQVVSLNGVQGSMSEGWRVMLTVANNTAHNIELSDGSATLYYRGVRIGELLLDESIRLPRRKCSALDVPIRLKLANPFLAIRLLTMVKNGNYADITVDYTITVKAMASRRVVSNKGVSLEALAKQFNLGLKK